MNRKYVSLFLALLLGTTISLLAQDTLVEELPSQLYVYKTIDTVSLELEIFQPPSKQEAPLPAMIFFYGGGWKGGSTGQFRTHAQYFAKRGIITVLADYRVLKRHGTSPFEAVADAKSAIRFLRQHADSLGIDPNRIIGSGGSAGGHLAAAAGLVPGLDDPQDDLTISAKPNALVLFNPVFDNGPNGYAYDRCGGELGYKTISPIHNIAPGAPPTIVFLGTEDELIPVATAEAYKMQMEAIGSRCELRLYEGQGHGFFNLKKPNHYLATVISSDLFLISLGYLKGEPDIISLTAYL